VYLDQLPLIDQVVSYGDLGTHGSLGYDGQGVSIEGHKYDHALSAHAPSRLSFFCGGEFHRLSCRVAINDDVATKQTSADFAVYADDRLVGAATQVRAGDPPRAMQANISGAQRLCLTAHTIEWPFCHSVWVNPEVTQWLTHSSSVKWSDALGRVEAQSPQNQIHAECCIATVVTGGYAHLLDGLLTTLTRQRWPRDTLVVVFNIDNDPDCARIIANHGARAIPCTRVARRNASLKSVLYSVASLVEAQYYMCLDADMLVLDDLSKVFDALDAYPQDSILVARDAFLKQDSLLKQLQEHYRGDSGDLGRLLGRVTEEGNYSLLINDGFFAGSRFALLALDNLLRNMSQAAAWVDFYPDHGWRNQFVFNLALARLRCAVELDARFNVQLHMNDPKLETLNGRPQAIWRGQTAHVLHFCGWGRDKYPEWRKHVTR